MLQIRRIEGRETIEHQGRRFDLVSESWTAEIATPWLAIGYSYRRPQLVSDASGATAIRDHLMVARLVAIAALALTILVRRMQP